MESNTSNVAPDGSLRAEDLILPESFRALSPYLGWALMTEQERIDRRVAASIAELRIFYEAMYERTPEITEFLSAVDVYDMTSEQRTLMRLAVAFAEIADAVDFYAPDSTAPIGVDRFTPVHDGLSWSAPIAAGP